MFRNKLSVILTAIIFLSNLLACSYLDENDSSLDETTPTGNALSGKADNILWESRINEFNTIALEKNENNIPSSDDLIQPSDDPSSISALEWYCIKNFQDMKDENFYLRFRPREGQNQFHVYQYDKDNILIPNGDENAFLYATYTSNPGPFVGGDIGTYQNKIVMRSVLKKMENGNTILLFEDSIDGSLPELKNTSVFSERNSVLAVGRCELRDATDKIKREDTWISRSASRGYCQANPKYTMSRFLPNPEDQAKSEISMFSTPPHVVKTVDRGCTHTLTRYNGDQPCFVCTCTYDFLVRNDTDANF